jgi:MoaA/NifB/PqqE/SkfB family radical SAM enzyme
VRTINFAIRGLRYWRRNGRYWSIHKAANALLAHLAWRLRMEYVPAGPMVAKIEATNCCNGTCRLCPVGRKEPGRRRLGMMDWDTYRRLIDEMKDTLHAVDLTNWGESLLHPRILDMIRYAHRARIYTYLSTNLHTVRPEHHEGLFAGGLDELALSLHGLSPATYEAYQPGFDFHHACETLHRLVEGRDRAAVRPAAKIKLNYVVTAVNEHEIADLPTFALGHGVDWVLSEPSLNLRFNVSPEMARRRGDQARQIMGEVAQAWLSRDGQYHRPLYRQVLADPARMYDPRKAVACDWPWTKLVVNWDGGLSICCGSYHASDDVGHYDGQPIRRLWNSRPYRLCRASFRRAADGKAGRVLCGRCPGLLL